MANIAGLLKARLATPEGILYRQFLEGGWREISAREIAAYAARWQAFLRAEGLAPADRLALCLKNGIHWVAADQGALGLGIVVVPLYADDNPENVAWCLENSGARLLVAESSRMADALQGVAASLPRVLCLAADPGSGHDAVEAALPRQAPAFEATPLEDDLASERPTVMFAVPRVFEKFAARVDEALAKSPVKKRLFDLVVAAGGRAERREGGPVDRIVLALLRDRVAKPVLARLGGRMRFAVVGGAPLDPAIAWLFLGLGLPVLQGYGMTEASPVISVNRPEANVPESVGMPLDNVEVRTAADGELLARGPSIMKGYWTNPEASAKSLDREGWLHTGDLAEIRDDRIFIRGRLKDVLVLSNGEKLPPQDVELAILGDGVFEQGILIGEGRPFLTLVAVTRETDEKNLIRRANDRLKEFPGYIRVRRVVTTREPWTVENGLLTPTLKVKRERVQGKFGAEIERAYAAGALD